MDNLDQTAERLAELLARATPGDWQRHCSHVYGPDPVRTLVAQFVNGPWLVNDIDLVLDMKNALPALLAERGAMKAEIGRLGAAETASRLKFDVAIGIARAMKTQANDLLSRLETLTEGNNNG